MFVELIESLRCPRGHEDAPLVASVTHVSDRHILEGLLGCPVCGAEFPIREGVARFDDLPNDTPNEPASVESAMRIAAFLELTDARGFALLCGKAAAHAAALFQLSDTPLLLLNPPAGAMSPATIGIVQSHQVAPLAASSARAAALDVSLSPALLRSTVRAVRPGGRIMAPAEVPLPEGVAEIVRDDREWVGQKTSAAPDPARLVTLKRSPP